MPKHKAKKKNLKKRVHRKVQKIKELTAQDLLLQPELLQSPQFKALPLEKQFQLTSQLKQLRMMMRPINGLGAVSSGNADSLYSKYLDTSSKLSQAQHETQKLKQQIEETERQRETEMKLQNELKDKEHRFNKTMKHNNAINEYHRQMDKLDNQFNVEQINDLKTRASQILDSQEQQKAQKRRDEWQKQNDEYMKQLAQIPGIDYEKAMVLYELSSIENQRRNNQMLSKLVRNRQELDELNEKRSILQAVSNTYDDNGEPEKAAYTEQQIANMNDEISQKKTTSLTDLNDDEMPDEVSAEIHDDINQYQESSIIQDEPDEPLRDAQLRLEQQNISLEAQKITMAEQVKEAQEELKLQQEVKQQEEMVMTLNNRNNRRAHMKQLQERHQLLKEINEDDAIIQPLIEDAKANVKDSNNLLPYIDSFERGRKLLETQYADSKTHEDKTKTLRQYHHSVAGMKKYLGEWKEQQEDIYKQVEQTKELQTQNGITTNPEYVQQIKETVKHSSPSKNELIQQKVINDQKQIESGISMMKQNETLYNKIINDSIPELQKTMIDYGIIDNGQQLKAWKHIASKGKDSYPALIKINQDLKKLIEATKNRGFKDVNVKQYLKDLQPYIDGGEIDVSDVQIPKQKLEITDEELKQVLQSNPNNVFQFKREEFNLKIPDSKVPPIYYNGQSLTDYLKSMKDGKKKSVFKAALCDATTKAVKFAYDHGIKQTISAVFIVGFGWMLLKVIPPSFTESVGQHATRFILSGIEDGSSALGQHTLALASGIKTGIDPELAMAKEAISNFMDSGMNWTKDQKTKMMKNILKHKTQIVSELSKTERGKKILKLKDSFDQAIPALFDAGTDLIESALELSPSLVRAIGGGLFINGKAIKWTSKAISESGNFLTRLSDSIYDWWKGPDPLNDVKPAQLEEMIQNVGGIPAINATPENAGLGFTINSEDYRLWK